MATYDRQICVRLFSEIGFFRPNSSNFQAQKKPRILRLSFYLSFLPMIYGGEGGIRTHGTLSRTAVFKTAALNHSATSPQTAAFGRMPAADLPFPSSLNESQERAFIVRVHGAEFVWKVLSGEVPHLRFVPVPDACRGRACAAGPEQNQRAGAAGPVSWAGF